MNKNKNIAADVQGLAATTTKEISLKEVKDGLKKIIEFEFENCQDDIQTYGCVLDSIYDFDWDESREYINTMNDLQIAYYELDDIKDDSEDSEIYDYIEDIIGSDGCYNTLNKKNKEEFVKAYSELGIDEAVLQRIAKIVMD